MAISLLLPVVSTSQPNLFDIVMRMVPRMRACRFSSARPGLGARERGAEQVEERRVGRLDRHGDRADAEVGREQLGVGDAAVAREARRHEHTDHVLGPERVDRDRRDQRGVDAAREPDEHVGEAVLAHVVAGAEHQRLVDLLHRRQQRLDARLRRGGR